MVSAKEKEFAFFVIFFGVSADELDHAPRIIVLMTTLSPLKPERSKNIFKNKTFLFSYCFPFTKYLFYYLETRYSIFSFIKPTGDDYQLTRSPTLF